MKMNYYQMAKKKSNNIFNNLLRVSLAILTIGLIWISISWVNFRGYMDINNYSYKGDIRISESEYAGLIGDITKQTHSEVDLIEIQERIEMHPYVQATRVSHQFPSTVHIEIVEREPLAILNGDPMVFLDENCFVMPEVGNLEDLNVPILSNYNPDPELYPIGNKANSVKVQESIKLLQKIQNDYESLYQNISEMSLNTDDEFIIVLIDQPTKIRLGRNNIWTKLLVLKEFEIAIQGKKSFIDKGGENFDLVPCLNYNEDHIVLFQHLVKKYFIQK